MRLSKLTLAYLSHHHHTIQRVNYTYEADPDHVCADKDPVPKCGANWEKFLEFLGTTLSDNPPEGMSDSPFSPHSHSSLSFTYPFLRLPSRGCSTTWALVFLKVCLRLTRSASSKLIFC